MATSRNYSGKCRKITISNLVVCGQWHRTEILKRSLKPSNSTNGLEEVFELYSGSSAKIETISGPEYFGVTNGSDNITHKFYYTFTPKLDLKVLDDFYIRFNNIYYDIIKITNYNELNKWLILQVSERGPDQFKVNTR